MSRQAKGSGKTWSTPVTTEENHLIPCILCGGLSFKPSLFCEGFFFVRCACCGLVQMNPQPLESEIKSRYCERSGEDYLAYELANEEAFLNLQLLALEDSGFAGLERKLFSKNFPQDLAANNVPSVRHEPTRTMWLNKSETSYKNRKPKVLDIGCATGSLLSALREKGWEATGVEISAPQAEYGRQTRNLDIRGLPLAENNFPPGCFDVVIASHIIEHINDPAGLVREVRRILAPGGRFFVTTPNIAGFQARLFGSRWRSAIFDHLCLFSKKTLSRLLGENGFAIEKTTTWGGLAAGIAPAPVKRLFDKAAKRLGFGDVMIMRAGVNL